MYRKDSEGWLKHADFIILDMICLQLAYVLAYAISGYGFNPYETIIYRNMAVFFMLADLIVIFAYGTMKSVLKRGYYREFVVALNHSVMVGALAILYLFLIQQGQQFSRLTLILTVVIYLIVTYLVREFWKSVLRKKMKDGGERKLLIITSEDVAEQVVENMKKNNYARYTLAGIAVIDTDWTGKNIHGVPVVANEETAPMYVCQEWIDEVLIVISEVLPYPAELIDKITETGVTVHLNLAKITNVPGKKQFVEKVGNYTVLTTSINYASTRQLMLKRLMDIAGGLVGCILTGIICIFVGPAIYLASPGPIFFAQERVGKNGKKFKMYKFRSMYMDAEERKAELMKDNKLGDGKMFKLDFDPRVIGNKILPDGTHKTGIGDFIRRTSLDEFPQFFNVLKGDMSIIGTRPPLISETSLYELHHRARLAIKPGITGMWQVSGRSDITDFEEVVRLDKEYIENWNIGMDIKILLKTVLVVFKKDGSM
ncbi:sugar transferase [Blautia sp. Marseille-P3201T]|jgi:exopolysaccharide biosynthesis polyprenyl glycosylphosphotransferase|uniref:sugar transferase n=1 Tax=Blautia sp. Marseille-P3201T TaxID=1907659 RepID=UPI000931C5CA|nr:sugar transferase [Blautia sp. Marseille-P3201T]RGY06535.1 sugar transferase [Blautia obeum]